MAVPLDPKLVQIRSVGKLPGVTKVQSGYYNSPSQQFLITYKGVIYELTYYTKAPYESSPAPHGLPYVELTHRSFLVLAGYMAPKHTSRNKVSITAIHQHLKSHYHFRYKHMRIPKDIIPF